MPKSQKPSIMSAWATETLKDLRNITFGQTLTAVVGLLGVKISLFAKDNRAAVISVLGTIAVASFIDRLSRAIFEKKTERSLADIIKQSEGLRHIGGIPDAVKWFVDNALDITDVEKIVQHPTSDLADPFTEVSKSFGKAAVLCLERGCSWEEIVLFNNDERVKNTLSELTSHQLRNYRWFYLGIDIPIPQIMLVTTRGRKRTVLYGFTFSGGGKKDSVFIGDDNETVEYFSAYYNQLRNAAVAMPNPQEPKRLPKRGYFQFGRRRPS